MTTETMTIHEALSELKIIGDRIESAINKEFVTINKKSNRKVNGIPLDEVVDNIKSRYQKVNDLIKRRNAIKRAVSISNAKTEIVINGISYTVAEAIEMNNSGIQYQEHLMRELANQLNLCRKKIQMENEAVCRRAEEQAVNREGKKESSNAKEFEEVRMNYIEENSYDLIDPLKLTQEIEKLEEEIAAFKTKVDSALSISNATTTITIEY